MADSSPMFYTSGGSMRVTVVDGTTLTGIMAADGSFNVVVADGTELTGIHHPCGGINVIVPASAVTGLYHACGALHISDEGSYVGGTVRVSVVSGDIGGTDPLAPPVPTIDLIAASDSGASSTDNITNDTTPAFDIATTDVFVEDDELQLRIDGVEETAHVITAGEAGGDPIELLLGALADGDHEIEVRHNRPVGATDHWSAYSSVLTITVDATAPTITSANTAAVDENDTLAHSLTANETVTWTITGGADELQFDLSGSTLTWVADGTQDYEAPADADTNNTYVVQVTATDTAGNTTNQTITVTVVNDTADDGTDRQFYVHGMLGGYVVASGGRQWWTGDAYLVES
jgi:hypothetical protein